MSAVAERVAKGAAFLDEREPRWDQRIDLPSLDLHSPCRCVLGQLATDLTGWDDILIRFQVRRDVWTGPRPTDVELGFNAHEDDEGGQEEQEYDDLTAEWKRVIAERREVAEVTR